MTIARKLYVLLVACGISALAHANEAAMEGCRAKLKQAQALGVLYGMDWKPPREPQVIGGPTYYQMPFDAKEGFAETVNCFLMAGRTGCLSFDVTHWQTGRPTDRFHRCRLTPR